MGSSLICFHCNQPVHKKADYPIPMSGAAISTAPATLKIFDGYKGMMEAPTVRRQVFHLTVKEAQFPLDVVVGTYRIRFFLAVIVYDYVIMI